MSENVISFLLNWFERLSFSFFLFVEGEVFSKFIVYCVPLILSLFAEQIVLSCVQELNRFQLLLLNYLWNPTISILKYQNTWEKLDGR